MATALQLAEAQRRAQAQLADALILRLRASWLASMRPAPTTPIVEAWIRRMLPVILSYRNRSTASARVSYAAQRSLILPDAAPIPDVDPDPLDIDALLASLLSTGIDEFLIDHYQRAMSVQEALERSATTISGAGMRYALAGGRSYLENAVDRDRVALGWYRVTREGACSFCAVLASRGAVYREDSFDESDPRFDGDGDEKVHDHCRCTIAPLFTRGQEIAPANLTYAELWYQSVKANEEDVLKGRAAFVGQKFSGKDALNSFRRRYERLYPPTAA